MSGRRGFFVVFEGLDGAGTSTQVRLLAERMRRERPDLPVAVTAEPSTGPAGSLIRQVLKGRTTAVTALGQPQPFDRRALALLFAADRLDHVACEIEPLVQAGWLVVSDRYVWSSLAYQSLDAPMEWICQVNRFAPAPDLLVVLDVPAQVGLSRVDASRPGREIFEHEETLGRVADAYRQSLATLPATRTCVLAGDRPVEDVAEGVWAAVRELIG
jgi:dTMP kinase